MIDLKNLRRDLDIQSEMRRPAPDREITSTEVNRSEAVENVSDGPKEATGLGAARSIPNDPPAGEGSVGYRIAAMVAMFLLALVAIVIWYYGR
jgi:hypothetical protein